MRSHCHIRKRREESERTIPKRVDGLRMKIGGGGGGEGVGREGEGSPLPTM